MTNTRSKAAVWFGRVVWIGVLANYALAVPTIIAPERMIQLTGVPPASPLLWVRFAALLLMLLSLLYIPGAIDPYRYRATAWLSVLSRLAGVVFFLPQPPYQMFGVFDGVFFVPELILLVVALKDAPVPAVATRVA